MPELVKRGVTVGALVRNEQRAGVARGHRGSRIETAQAAGVRKFVFSGVIHPSISAMVNHRAKQSVEEALYGSSMDFTVLQPAMFISVKVCWVDYRDVAEVAALAMTGDELSCGVFELCAPGMVDRVQMAAMISEEIGRRIEAQETPRSQWASRLPEGPLREGLTRMMAHYDEHGFPGGNALVLRTILGREPRSPKEYFHELATHQA